MTGIADPADFCPDPDPNFQIALIRILHVLNKCLADIWLEIFLICSAMLTHEPKSYKT
jgi:hypothetical protein